MTTARSEISDPIINGIPTWKPHRDAGEHSMVLIAGPLDQSRTWPESSMQGAAVYPNTAIVSVFFTPWLVRRTALCLSIEALLDSTPHGQICVHMDTMAPEELRSEGWKARLALKLNHDMAFSSMFIAQAVTMYLPGLSATAHTSYKPPYCNCLQGYFIRPYRTLLRSCGASS